MSSGLVGLERHNCCGGSRLKMHGHMWWTESSPQQLDRGDRVVEMILEMDGSTNYLWSSLHVLHI